MTQIKLPPIKPGRFKLPDSGYRALPIGSLTELFCATPLYLNRHGSIDSIEDLSRQRWIAMAWQSSNVGLRCLKSDKKTAVNLKAFAKNNSLPAAIGMTLRHLGIALVPDILAKPMFQSGHLVHIAKDFIGPEWPVYTVHAYQHEKPIHISRFHQLVCRRFEGL